MTENKLLAQRLIPNHFFDLKTGEVINVDESFHTGIEVNLVGTNKKKLLNKIIDECLEKMANFQRRGNNWQIESINKLEIPFTDYKPLKGNSYIPLPKKPVINMNNEALNPVGKNSGRITQDLRKQSEKCSWNGIKVPMELDKILKFEKINDNISYNVFVLF